MTFNDLPESDQKLFDSYLEETISPEDFSRLESRLSESSELRRAFRSYLALDDNLTRLSETESNSLSENPGSDWLTEDDTLKPRKSKFWPVALAASVAFLFGLASMRIATKPEPSENKTVAEQSSGIEDLKAEGFAVLVQVSSPRWAESQDYREGDSLSSETLKLQSGSATIQFFSGASMILKGPTELSLTSAWEATCHEGTVRMKVPPAARGFKLHSPSTEIIDLGTEFGFQVQNGEGHVEVFDGEIALTHLNEEQKILHQGSSLRLAKNGPSESFPNGKIDFPEVQTNVFSQHQQTSYERWKEYRDGVAKTPSLLAYFTFEQAIGSPILPNLLSPSDPELNGTIILAESVGGRWPQHKQALEFRRPGSRVRVNLPGTFPAFTFAAWVRVDSLSHRYSALFMADSYENGEPHWQIRHDGKLMLSIMVDETGRHPAAPKKSRYHHIYFSPPIWDISKSGQWIHLASTYDPETQEVSHYLDGRKISSEPIQDLFLVTDLKIGNAEIGNWGQPFREDPSFAIRNLNGRLDELALFKKALSEKEIKDLYDTSLHQEGQQ